MCRVKCVRPVIIRCEGTGPALAAKRLFSGSDSYSSKETFYMQCISMKVLEESEIKTESDKDMKYRKRVCEIEGGIDRE